MQLIDLLVEALSVQPSLRSENRHRVSDVLFFLGGDGGKGLAQAPRCHLPDAGIARYGEGFQHDLLDDQAADEVALRDAAHECVAETLPMPRFDVIGDVHSNLA